MAEDRQGSGAPGFAAPSFNIPFQPNFQFNEFGNFLDSNGGFSQFVSGLGSQSLRQGGGDFVQQTEQRFTRPQIGSANIGAAAFKRETEPTQTFQTFHQSVEPPSFKVHRHKAPVRQRPLKRYDYDAGPVDREPVRMIQQRHKPSGHMETPRNTDRNFHQFHEDDRETDFGFGNNMRYKGYEKMNIVKDDEFKQKVDQKSSFRPLYEPKVEARELLNDHQSDLNNIFDVKSFNFDFEPEKFSTTLNTENEKKEKERNFTPPDLVEKFNSPLRKSEAFSYPEEPKMSKLTKERMNKFTDFGSSGQNIQSFKDFKTQDIPKKNARVPDAAVSKPLRQRYNPDVSEEKQPTFTNFPQTKSFQKKSNPTKKPTKPLSFEKIPSYDNFKAYNSAKPTKKTSSKPSKKFPSFMNFKPQTPSIPQSSFKSNPSPPQKSLSSFTAVTPSESVQPFTNFDPQPKTTPQPQIVSLPTMKKERKEPQLPPMPTVPPTPTQKPYNYEKKNFRQPLQQVNKNSGQHQIIRIKAQSRDGRPQPKQLFQTPASRRTDSGFQPIIGRQAQPALPTPGQLLIQEVTSQEASRRYHEANRRYQEPSQEASRRYQEVNNQEASRRYQEPSQETNRRYQEPTPEASRRYQEVNNQEASRRHQEPSQVVYDNQQPLITLDSVSQGGFRAQSRPDNFAINVQASLGTNKKRPVRIQRRLMRLPSPKFSQIIRKSPKTMNVATSSSQSSKDTNKFESSRILRPRN